MRQETAGSAAYNVLEVFLKTRVISGVAVVAIILAVIWPGGIVSALGIAAISSIGFVEFTNALGINSKENKLHLFQFLGICATVAYDLLIFSGADYRMLMLYIVILLPLFMLITVITYPANNSKQAFSAYVSFVYVAVSLGFLLMTRNLKDPFVPGVPSSFFNRGFFMSWLIVISAWGCDTCAYFVGVLLGRHKAFPKLSPRKSIEGCIGGSVGAGLLGLLYAFIVGLIWPVIPGMYWIFPLTCFMGSILGQVGDLSASAVKRDMGIKDYGKIIPGHGGVLDRFDSMIFTAPMIYLCYVLFL